MKPKLNNLILLLLAGIVFCCTQNELLTSSPALNASKTESIKRGEPVLFTFKSDSTGRKIEWSVSPAGQTQLKALGAKASITFLKAGQYKVTASNTVTTEQTFVTVDSTLYFPSDTATSDTTTHVDVPVTDTTVTVPQADTVRTDTIKPVKPIKPTNPDSVQHITDLTGDELLLTPYLIDSLPSPSLGIKAVTTKNYKCSFSYLLANATKSGDDLKLNYSGVYEYFECIPGNYNLKAFSYFSKIKTGTSTLEISMNGVIYKGTITSDGKTFTITWPYSSGIKFTTLTAAK